MKKKNIIGIAIVAVILIALFVFAGTHKFSDSHLRIDGIRVKVDEYALTIEDCDEKTRNAAYCKKNVVINGNNEEMTFEFKNFNKSGYPDTIAAAINGHEFYREDGLDIEHNGTEDYRVFLNFKVIDKYVVFTITNGTQSRTTTLYAIDKNGNIVLQDYEIDKDDMLIKDYVEFIEYKDNKIILLASRLSADTQYEGKSICLAPKDAVVDAYYTYTYKDGKFSKKQTKAITASQYIKDKQIGCG